MTFRSLVASASDLNGDLVVLSRSVAEQTLLLEMALAMMFSDGSADPSEVAALQEIALGTPYFAAIDAEVLIRDSVHRAAELQQLLSLRSAEITGYAEQPARRRRLFEVLLIVLRADGQIALGELAFLRAVLRAVSMSDADLVRVLPDAASVLFGGALTDALFPVAERSASPLLECLDGLD